MPAHFIANVDFSQSSLRRFGHPDAPTIVVAISGRLQMFEAFLLEQKGRVLQTPNLRKTFGGP